MLYQILIIFQVFFARDIYVFTFLTIWFITWPGFRSRSWKMYLLTALISPSSKPALWYWWYLPWDLIFTTLIFQHIWYFILPASCMRTFWITCDSRLVLHIHQLCGIVMLFSYPIYNIHCPRLMTLLGKFSWWNTLYFNSVLSYVLHFWWRCSILNK